MSGQDHGLKHGETTGTQHPPNLLHHLAVVAGVLHDPMRKDEIKRLVWKRECFPVGNLKACGEPLLLEILPRQVDGTLGDIDPGCSGTGPGKPDNLHARPAAHIEHVLSFPLVEVNQIEQVVEFFEVVLVEIGKKPGRSRGVLRDLEIVDVGIPIGADAIVHAGLTIEHVCPRVRATS